MTAFALFRGEDILTASCEDSETLQAKAEFFRQSGFWEEVVQGMTDLTVKYDPIDMTGEEAHVHFRKLWDAPLPTGERSGDMRALDAGFAIADSLDGALIADRLGIKAEGLPGWLSQRNYRVTMMGFQPGFAYLEDCDPTGLPTLPRLATPRQRVAAGSIGFLGGRACIYALDGPGGWPIIGRVHEPLFRRDDPQPFLLEPGQMLRFRPA